MSLRARVLLGMGLIAVVLTLATVVITTTTRAHLTDQVDAQLRDAAPRLRPRAGGAQPPGSDGPTPQVSNLYVGTVSARGVVTTLHAPDLRGDTAPLPVIDADDVVRLRDGQAITVASDKSGSRYRLLVRAQGERGGVAIVGLSLDDVDNAVRRLVAVEAAGVLTALGVLGLVTFWVIRLGVRPVRRMTETAGAIAAGDLSQRVPEGAAGTEAGALGVALNGMLGRIEEAFDQRTASEQRLRQFVADASHELRTPVTTIRGYAELYRTGALRDTTELSEAMRRTEQEAVRMGGLVDDLLRLARLDQGRAPATAPVDLAALATDAVRDARAAAPERAIALDAPAPVVVEAEEDGMRQVVANLVGNALVHAPGAEVRVTVSIAGGAAVLEVSDDGPGMSADDSARAFERFYRADSSRSRHQGGTGLGLAIVESTVHAHGGTVSLTSALGAGTTVRVELPLHPPPTPRVTKPATTTHLS
ncbi:MAG: sensor histidine kinase [Microthrixaceae bacterium]